MKACAFCRAAEKWRREKCFNEKSNAKLVKEEGGDEAGTTTDRHETAGRREAEF